MSPEHPAPPVPPIPQGPCLVRIWRRDYGDWDEPITHDTPYRTYSEIRECFASPPEGGFFRLWAPLPRLASIEGWVKDDDGVWSRNAR